MPRRTHALTRRRHSWWPLLAALMLLVPASRELRSAAAAERVWTEFAPCKHFFPSGLPPIVPRTARQRELCFDGFAMLYSGQTKTPVFVAEHLDRLVLQQAGKLRRGKHFYAEARLPAEERADIGDYRHSGYSLGHMAPAGDMGTAQSKAQSFSLANMAPQDVELNNGAWNAIEQDTRKYVLRAQADVYIFTGPVYAKAQDSIGAGQVQVPQYFYKLVYDPANGRSWAHWQPNAPRRKVSEPISYEELVRRMGIEFVPR